MSSLDSLQEIDENIKDEELMKSVTNKHHLEINNEKLDEKTKIKFEDEAVA